MGKSVKPPPSPDYSGLAQQQGQANTASAQATSVLGNPNISNPSGFQTVNYSNIPNPNYNPNDPNSPQNFLQPSITQQYYPEQQAAYEQQVQAQGKLAGLANQQTTNVGNILNQPYQFSGQLQTSLPGAGSPAGATNPYGYDQTQFGIQGSPNLFAYGGATSLPQGFAGTPNVGYLNQPNLAQSIDASQVAPLPVNAGTTAQQAILSRLDPQQQRQRTSTETQLVNQGLRPGDEAYNNAITLLGQQENDARTQAALQGLGLDFQANQQGFGQALQQGAFGNQAQLSGFGAGLQNVGQYNAAQQQLYGQGLGTAGFGNQALAQNQQTALAGQQAQNTAQGQEFGQNQQAYQNQLAYQQAQNAAQQQLYNQQLGAAQFGNTAQGQEFAQGLTQYNNPLNAISTLLNGGTIANPQYQGYQGGQVAPAPVFAGGQAQGAYNQQTYGQQVAQRNALMQGLFGLGGAFTGGLIG